jgi:hypothetical protein
MASGVVPVVLSNEMEKYMVKDKITGLVTQNEEEYIKAIEFLYDNPDKREKLSQNARKYALETFSLDIMNNEWEKIFNEVLTYPKTVKRWKLSGKKFELLAIDVFLEALGNYGEDFKPYLNAKNDEEKGIALKTIKNITNLFPWRAKTRGTVHHYYEFFKDDQILQYWSKIMSGTEKYNLY